MKTSKVCTTAGFRWLSTNRALIRKAKVFCFRRNQGRIREVGLEDIISDAGHGAVLGGITRPISGLWGNLKYWWFGGGEEPAAIDQQ
jgi:hypothetical protein